MLVALYFVNLAMGEVFIYDVIIRQSLFALPRGRPYDENAFSRHPQAKDTDGLETLITYLSDRRAYLPNYKGV
jgi:hypothetical protein